MKIYVVSDTHGRVDFIINEILYNNDSDAIIHLGDCVDDANEIEQIADKFLYKVRGNNDFFSNVPEEKVIYLGKFKCLLTHGHKYFVYFGIKDLAKRAKELGCSIVFYGHTHIRKFEYVDGIYFINPGSLSYARSNDGKRSYAIVDIVDDNLDIEFVYQD